MSGYKVAVLARESSHPKSLINKKIWAGEVPFADGLVPEAAARRILEERKKYISLVEYASLHVSDRFPGKSSDREKLLFYLEENGFYGLPYVDSGDILMGVETDGVYMAREDIPRLDQCLEDYFAGYGLTGREQISGILKGAAGTCPETVRLLREYINTVMFDMKDYPPSAVIFVRAVTELPDIRKLKTADVKVCLEKEMPVAAREHIIRFLSYCKGKVPVRYADVSVKPPPRRSTPSYTMDTYLALMRCVFNPGYIQDHQMIEKALSSHLYAEAWLYVALFAACGWRAADVCRGWKYLRLHEREGTLFEINKETLHDDILTDRIPNDVYEKVCKYCLSSVDAAGQLARKTNIMDPPTLKAVIRPELAPFYGMLTLIGEAHMLRTGDGYMVPSRASEYQSKVTVRDFFGQEMLDILGGENLQSRRLNKVFLQGTEDAARKNGNSGLMAAMVAGYARSHTSLDAIQYYLRDHAMTGETAEMVLYFMMERGVFGFLYYQTLCLAYPEAVKKLPMKKQNELVALMDEKPLELEMKQAELVERYHIQEEFRRGKTDTVKSTMLDMLEISQGRGKAKDQGLYCVKRARGEACVHPEYASCLAGCCPFMVFTRDALIPLLTVLKSYREKAKHDPKDEAVFKKVMVPFYQDTINGLMRQTDMAKEDRLGITKIMKEVLYG